MPEFRPPAMFSNPMGGPAPGIDGVTQGSRISQDFAGGAFFVGGSMPEEGKSPFDEPAYYNYGAPSIGQLMGLPTWGQAGGSPPPASIGG